METAVVFPGPDGSRVGILHSPDEPQGGKGILVVVGGPQYRAGSHRHFVLLARALADAGFPVLRFDYRGMGDSDGAPTSFDFVGDDIEAAIDTLCEHHPGVRQVVLWGLCDGASAALMYAAKDPRVAALVLLNPWVRSDAGQARAYLRHYYIRRLFDRAFWRRLVTGRWRWRDSIHDFGRLVARLRRSAPAHGASAHEANAPESFIDRMDQGWGAFRGRILLILSGNDLTADEFRDWVGATRRRRAWLKHPDTHVETVRGANHTFARRDWRDKVNELTADWLRSW